jgi:hypothetical protein
MVKNRHGGWCLLDVLHPTHRNGAMYGAPGLSWLVERRNDDALFLGQKRGWALALTLKTKHGGWCLLDVLHPTHRKGAMDGAPGLSWLVGRRNDDALFLGEKRG